MGDVATSELDQLPSSVSRKLEIPLISFGKWREPVATPDSARNREIVTFQQAAKRVHTNLQPTWRSKRHGQNWLSSLERFAFPKIGNRPIETIGTADILKILEPIWTTKFDTANRIKQRISRNFRLGEGSRALSPREPS